MKVACSICLLLLPIAMAIITGCTDGGAIAFRDSSRNDMHELVRDSQSVTDSQSITQKQDHEAGSPVSKETLVNAASVSLPQRHSLVTLQTGDDLTQIINEASGPVLLDFYADWCGPCRIQSKILHDMEGSAARHRTLMVKINIDDHPEIAQALGVQGIPTLIMVKEGKVAYRQSGVADAGKLAQWMQ